MKTGLILLNASDGLVNYPWWSKQLSETLEHFLG